jgi:hypothetical protein
MGNQVGWLRFVHWQTAISFFTAWTPPVPIIKKFAELHKDMVFRLEYYETSMAFRGIATAYWQNGEAVLEDSNWNMTDRDFRNWDFCKPRQRKRTQNYFGGLYA